MSTALQKPARRRKAPLCVLLGMVCVTLVAGLIGRAVSRVRAASRRTEIV
jgi:hypothetical protein